jgi:phosphoribosylanthranilate isomerase
VFHVKICGVTTPDDARLVATSGADAIGLNFVPGSPRWLEPAVARAVAEAVPAGVVRVGVFAGAAADEMRAIAAAVGLDAVQLHGRVEGSTDVDPPALCVALRGLPVIRAVRLEPGSSDPLAAARRWLAEATARGRAPDLVLVDAAVSAAGGAGGLGGTGAVVDWHALSAAEPLGVPLVLAGGLTPDNVAAAIRATGVTAVDVASGVESAPGRKDPVKAAAFVAAARRALGLDR